MNKIIKNSLHMLRYVLVYCPSLVFFSLCVSLLNIVNNFLNMYFMKVILDVASGFLPLSFFINFIIFLFCFSVTFSLLSTYHKHIFLPKQSQILEQKMQTELYDKLIKIELSEYDDTEFYNIYTLATGNANQRALAVLETTISFFSNSINLLALITLLLALDKFIMLTAIVVSFVVFIINTILAKLTYNSNKELILPNRKTGYIRRVFYLKDYSKELRITDISNSLFSFYNQGFSEIISIIKKYGLKKVFLNFCQTLILILYNIGIAFYLMFEIISKSISIGNFSILFNGSNQLISSINTVLQSIPRFYEHSLFIDSFRKFMEYPTKTDGFLELKGFETLNFNNVHFEYTQNKLIISDININIKRGEAIAFVGLNGAGKTTLTKLSLGLYEPTHGNILLNNNEYANYSRQSINKYIGAVFQDYKLFSLSIAENILMRQIDKNNFANDEKIVTEALEKVGLKDKVLSYPNGIHTHLTKELDSNGAIFSEGEFQKLAIARALAKKYELLILDEPSSSLDVESESLIFEKILSAYDDKTVIMISHRLSNIKNVDRIYFIDNGRIVEEGTHDDLIRLNGRYAKLYRLQAQNY